jgi:hypothetical protein
VVTVALRDIPGARTVTVIRQVRQRNDDDTGWARDGRGNAVYTEQRTDVPGCSVQPATGSETDDQGRVQVTATTTIYAPLTWPGGPIDAVEFDGLRWNIKGRPARWEHPRLGHVIVAVEEAS